MYYMNRNITTELNYENMPHSHVLSGLLKNVLQATQIVKSHILETLPNAEEIEEEAEFSKKKKILQTIIAAEDDKKEKIKETEACNTLRRVSIIPVHRLKNVMFKKMVLKLILNFYDERVKEKGGNENFCDFVYNILLKKYMMKKAAENKFHHLLASCVKYKFITRVRVFGRFLGLYDEFDSNDLQFYIDCLIFLQNSPSGVFNVPSDSLDSVMVPYVRCVECIKYFENFLSKKDLPLLKSRLDKMKKDDKLNKSGVVDIDEFLEILIETHNDHNKNTKNFMQHIYGAADLNDDGYLQFKEFELLMRFLSEVPYSENIIKMIFGEYAETFLSEEDEEVKAISFENLCQLNLRHKAFTSNCIKNLTGNSNDEEALIKLEDLDDKIEDIIDELY